MSGSDLSDFLRLPFVTSILLFLIGIGAIYVALIVIIFRRAAARRRKRREEAAAVAGAAAPQAGKSNSMPLGNFLRGELPERPLPPAEWTVPAELRSLPEPDLDMLTGPLLAEQEPAEVATNVIPEESVTAPAETADWVAAVVPVEETPMAPATTDSSSQESRNVNLGDAVEVMRVWRDLSDGSLIIQMGDQRYRTMNDIQNPDLSRRFVAVVRELWAIVNNAPARITGANESAVVPPPSNSAGGMKSRMGLLSAEPEQPPRPHMLKQVAKQALGQTGPTQPEQPSGIANAVEDFLQFKLSTTPEFAKRSIHFRPSHDLGVRIEVDGHYYDAIGDVVDPDVREFLQELMREWEARH
jgi:hypothetical protein